MFRSAEATNYQNDEASVALLANNHTNSDLSYYQSSSLLPEPTATVVAPLPFEISSYQTTPSGVLVDVKQSSKFGILSSENEVEKKRTCY